MRVLLAITIVIVVAVTAWSSIPTVAQQHGTATSIDPAAMTTNTTNLPEWRYDLF